MGNNTELRKGFKLMRINIQKMSLVGHNLINRKYKTKKGISIKRYLRWYKNVGLGIKTPESAIQSTYIDKKCPFTGNMSIRGRTFLGVVKSTKMYRAIVVRRNYFHY